MNFIPYIIIGSALIYYANRKKFNRRNSSGNEEFKSYEKAVGTGLINGIIKIAAYAFIIIGIVKCAN